MNPKVSVIIPCYNQAAYLPKAVASLQAQTLEYWECIIVDDGSTDNTAEVVSNLALRDERVRLVQKLNGGSASARDTGLKTAKGQYIQFLDADDTIAPEKLEQQVAQMERDGLDISYTAFCSEDSQGQHTRPKHPCLSLYRILVYWGLGASVPIHSFLYRADFIRQHELRFQSDCRYREDWKWHIQCFMFHPRHAGIKHYCGAIYYQNEQGKTSSYIKMQEGNFAFIAYMAVQLKGMHKLLWTMRTSEELWIWMLRMIKYRSTAICHSIRPLHTHKGLLISAILMMPLSVFGVLRYSINTYLLR